MRARVRHGDGARDRPVAGVPRAGDHPAPLVPDPGGAPGPLHRAPLRPRPRRARPGGARPNAAPRARDGAPPHAGRSAERRTGGFALAVAARSELVPEWSAAPLAPVQPTAPTGGTTDESSRLTLSELRVPALPRRALDAARQAPDQFVNALLSTLEFNVRVLELAEDPRVPLLARLRFLAIFSTNLDQFFMVDLGALQHQVAAGVVERSPDGLTPAEQLDAIAIRLHPLIARQYRSFRELLRGPLAAQGIGVRDWAELDLSQRTDLARRFADDVAPLLTPKALTRAPGHAFPHLADRRGHPPGLLRGGAGGPPPLPTPPRPPPPPPGPRRGAGSELASALGPSDVYAADGPVHLGAVTELAGAHPRPELDYPPLAARDPFPANRGVFDALDSGDVLVHHPYDGFAESFERFIAEAADDPAVAAIKLTLYRPRRPSALAG